MADIRALDGLEAGAARLRLGELEPRSYAEQSGFELYLEHDGRESDRPVLHGLVSAGRSSQHISGWIDGYYGGVARFGDERVRLSDLGAERPLFEAIGATLAPGGWLGLAYETLGEDTPPLAETRRLLGLGVPPIATPLGELLHIAGCGLHIRNWYISEGWREGPRRLQGTVPSNIESGRRGARETVRALEEFLARGDGPELAGAVERARRLVRQVRSSKFEVRSSR